MRRDVVSNAYRRYVAGHITRVELLRTVRQWRPRPDPPGQVVLDDPEGPA